MRTLSEARHFAQLAPIADLIGHDPGRDADLYATIHKIRDTEAAFYTYSKIARGMTYRGPIYDFPAEKYGLLPPSTERIAAVLTKDTLLIIDRRLALDDVLRPDEWPDDRPMERTDSYLEKVIHEKHRVFFEWCSRKVVILSDHVMKSVSEESQIYRTTQFQQRGGAAWLRQSKQIYKDKRRDLPGKITGNGIATFGYATYLPHISEEFPSACLCVFGMNGASTLLFSHLLADSAVLATMAGSSQPRLVMFEFSPKFPTFEPLDVRTTEMPVTLDDIPVGRVRTILDVTL